MTLFPNIPTMDQVAADPEITRRRLLKPSRADRAKSNQTSKRLDERKLAQWRAKVRIRDKGIDRYTGKPTIVTMELLPNRGEAHHVESRADEAVRYDVRNGLHVSFNTHQLIEQNKLEIVGTKFFRLNGKKYIDCDYPVRFVKPRA